MWGSVRVYLCQDLHSSFDVIPEFVVSEKDCGENFFPEAERAISGWWA